MSYSVIEPPKDLKIFPKNIKWFPAIIDYSKHDAYAEFLKESDKGISISNTLTFFKFFVVNMLKRIVLYELIPLHIRKPKSLSGYLDLIKISIIHTCRIRSKKFKKINHQIGQNIFDQMEQTGVAVVKISDMSLENIEAISTPWFEKLKERRRQKANGDRDFEESRSYARRDSFGGLFEVVEKTLEESGVLYAASKYLNRDAKLVDINPQINDVSDNFWAKIFSDVKNLVFPKTAYFHRDASGGDLKAIFYMSNVSSQNGPFTYALGTHRMSISKLDDLICETNDSSGFSGTSIKNRTKFSSLPSLLRQKGTFGNDLDNESSLSNQILDSAWTITANKGSIVLFDTKGVHRGGMVLEGERYVLTCVVG